MRAVDVLGGVQRLVHGDALAPALAVAAVSARTRSTSRSVSVPNDVRNGDTSGSRCGAARRRASFIAPPRSSMYQPSRVIAVADVAVGDGGAERVAQRQAPVARQRRVVAAQTPTMSSGTQARSRSASRGASAVSGRPSSSARRIVVPPSPAGRDAVPARRPSARRPGRCVAGVDGVGHLAVEVRLEADDAGAELGQVEVGVAPDERVERPRDDGDAPLRRPRPLVLLEGEPDVRALPRRQHAGDVRVEVEPVAAVADEARPTHRPGDPSGEGTDDVAAGVGQRLEQAGVDRRLALGMAPDGAQEGGGGDQLVHRLEAPDLDPRARLHADER